MPKITDDFKTIADAACLIRTRRAPFAKVHAHCDLSRLTSAGFQFHFGKLYAVFRTKRVFLTALAVYEAGSLLCAVAPSLSVFFSAVR
jgi:hypothetical protein